MITKIFLILLLIVFPLGQLGRISLGEGINFIPLDVMVFLTVLAWFFNQSFHKSAELAKLKLPLFLFMMIGFLSLVINSLNLSFPSFISSFLYLVRFVFYAGIYFVLLDQNSGFQKKFKIGLMISGLVIVVGGFIQYFLYPDLRNLRYLGWDEHLYRLFSSFLDPNFAGAFFVLELILITSLLFQKTLKQTWQKYGLKVSVFLTFIALLLTYSRSAYVMFILSLLIILVLNKRIKWLVSCLLIFLVGILILTIRQSAVPSEGVNLLRTASIGGRLESIEHSIIIIKDHPLFGIGFNAYRFAQKRYGFLDEANWQEVHGGAGVENSFLFVLATTGVIGLGAYLFLWHRIFSIGSTVLIVSSIGLFIDSLFINSLFYPPFMLWVWMLSAITERG